MAFEDLIGGFDEADDDFDAPDDVVSPDLIQSRAERKGLPTDVGARARTIDFGADDEVVGPAPKPRRAKAPAADFGADDEVVDAMFGQTVPTPRGRPAAADVISGPVPLPAPRPVTAFPPVQDLEGAPFRSPMGGPRDVSRAEGGLSDAPESLPLPGHQDMTPRDDGSSGMLTGDEAYKEYQGGIAAAEAGVAEARARLDAAEQRDRETSGAHRRRGTSMDQQRLVIEAELERARANLTDAENGLAAARRAAPPTQTPFRDASARGVTALGSAIPDTVGGFARPLDAALDLAGIKGGTGIAENMRKVSKDIGLAYPADPTRDEDLTAKLGAGAGSAVGFILTGAAGRAAGATATMTSALAGGAQQAEQYYREADDLGAPAWKKALAFVTGGAIGATEGIGIGGMADALKSVNKATGGGVKRYLGLVLKETGEEGLQEGVQQLLDNIAKYGLYGKDPGDITAGVATNALIGALLGMGMAGTMGLPGLAAGRNRAANEGVPVPPQVPVTPEDIAAQVLGQPSTPPTTPTSPPDVVGTPSATVQPSATTPQPVEAVAQNNEPATPPDPGQTPDMSGPVRPEIDPADRSVLLQYGYNEDNLADMSPAQIAAEVAAAQEAGIEPEAEFGQDDQVAGARAAPVEIKTPEDVKAVAAAAGADYTPAQGEANNRPLGHGKWNGLPISMEVAKGGVRKMVNPKTKEPVEVTHAGAAYGYIKGTVGADGMHVDLYMGENPESDKVFIIDEIDRDTGKFRQSKVMGGFNTEAEARAAYVGTSSKGEDTVGGIGETTIDGLKDWLKSGDTRKPFLTTKAVTPAKPTKSSEPMSLLQFIASKGGLRPDPELTILGITGSKRVQIPGRKGFFGVVRPTGESIENMREMAEEAGYLRGEFNKTSTPDDLLKAMDAEERGQRKAAEGEEGIPTKAETQRLEEENANRDAIEAANRAEIEAMLRDAGMPEGITNEEDIALAARIMADEGLDAADALDRAALRNLDEQNAEDVTQEEVDDTFGFGAIDAVQPRPVQEDERPAAAEGGGEGRPREEGRPDEPVDDVPRAGEDRERPGQGEAAEAPERAEQAPDEGPAADQGVDEQTASRAIEDALDKIEEAVEAGDADAVKIAARAARKVLAETPQSVKDADPEHWKQFAATIGKMAKPGYVTAKQQAESPEGIEEAARVERMREAQNKVRSDIAEAREAADNNPALADLGPVERNKEMKAEASRRYPGDDGWFQRNAFTNGANGYQRDTAMPINADPAETEPAYQAGKAWVRGEPEPSVPATRDGDLFIEIGGKHLPLTSYAAASEAYMKAVEQTGATSSGRTGPMAPPADITNSKGEVVAHISYNGKVWSGDRETAFDPNRDELTTLLYNPTGPDGWVATEQTEAGEQTVLPGTEKGVATRSGKNAFERGKERVAPKHLKNKEKADWLRGYDEAAGASEKSRPKVAQKPADDGLFGDEKDQTDLLDVKPAAPTDDASNFEIDPATRVATEAEAKQKGGQYTAVARRLKPFSSERGYGDMPLLAQNNALKRLKTTYRLQEPVNETETEPARESGPSDSDRAAERDAPTWAEILATLPMSPDGRTRQHEIAFDLMTEITGDRAPKYDDLTPAQKQELMARLNKPPAPAPNPKIDADVKADDDFDFDSIIDQALDKYAPEKPKERKPKAKKTERKIGDNEIRKSEWKDIGDGYSIREMVDKGPSVKTRSIQDIKTPEGNILTRGVEGNGAEYQEFEMGHNPMSKGGMAWVDKAIAYLEKRARTPKVGTAAKSAAKNTVMGLTEVANGLGALFISKNKLGAGPTFDEETYAKAKPFFKAGVAHFAQAGRDVKEMLDELVKYLIQTAGFDRDAVDEMRDYLKQFAADVKSGAISLTETTDEHPGTDRAGAEALDDVPAEQGSGVEGERGTERGPARGGEPGAGGDRDAAEEGLSGTRGEGSGAADVHPAQTGAGRGGRRAGAGTRRNGSGVSKESAAAIPDGRSGPERVTPEQAPSLPAVNYRITDETELGQGSEGTKFRDNVAAIETLKTIERERRRATPAEQRTLARYVGWGGLANAFRDTDGNLKPDWQGRGEQLESLLTKEELTAARRSTRNAHYTSRTVVDAMWGAAKHLGFKGGLSLELSAGTGNFLGLVPEDIAGNTRFLAVEFDSLTARIAKALYPQDTVLHSGLHKVPMPDGEAVLNIGNPPFGSESLRFQYKPELAGLSIHNQFFLAGLDALRPGGLQIMVVSRYLMDAQDSKAREMIGTKAKLLGAIRLPDTAFKENARTEVVTDILFLQRRTKEEEAEAVKDLEEHKKANKKDEKGKLHDTWLTTTTIPDPLGGEPMVVNRYFASNPRMVMGTLDRSGSMRGKDEVNVTLPKGTDLGAMLRKAIDRLPRDVLDLHQEVMDATIERHKTMGESLAIALAGHEIGHVEREDGKLVQVSERETPSGGYEPIKREITADSPWSRALVLDADGKYYVMEAKVDDQGKKIKKGRYNVYERKYFEGNVVPSGLRLGKTGLDKLNGLVTLRDLVKRQLVLESEDAAADAIEENRGKLAKAYQSYTASNGLLNDSSNVKLLNDLPDGALVAALESSYRAAITHKKAARTGQQPKPASATPAPIMSRRVVPKYEPATRAETPQDALSITLSEVGHADMDRIAQLLGISREEAIERLTAGETPLLYKDPETGGYDTRNAYLSGQVARKLIAAQAAGLTGNVKALEAVQPERWGAENVSVIMGSAWVPPHVYEAFVTHLLGVPARVNFSAATNSFNMFVDEYSNEKHDQWGSNGAPPDAIVRNMLNSRSTKVMDRDNNDKPFVDQEKTALAALKQKEIENEFSDWVFRDADRRNLLVDIFNEKFNTRVNRQHDGSHLTLPGKVPDEVIKLRRHQKNAVWRGIYERFMLLDHVVGAGKTFTAIARAMERRRMGLSRKPIIVVPNHLVEQWTADVYRLYPAAKVLAAGSNKFDMKNRRRLFAKIATGDWDIVIVPHSSFGFIEIAPETETRFLEEELRIARTALKEAEEATSDFGGRGKPFTVKQAEALVTKLETKLDALKRRGRDNMLTFEQMGVDDLTVDEAHEFKNLFYASSMSGVKGMGDKSGSQKAFDLYSKVRVLRETPTGTVTFMTGTPISNSAVEMYTMMRYLAAQDLADLGLEHFDAWRTQSVSATAAFEPTESGSGLKEVTRLGRSWSNMRALMELYYSFTDSVSQDDINKWYAEDNNGARFPVPKVKDGGRKEIIVKPTPAQRVMLSQIVADFNGLPGIRDPEERNRERLRLMDRARKVSMDVRAVESTNPSREDGGKLDQIADNVIRIYKATTADAGTQLVFIDRSVKASKGDNKKIKAYDDLLARRDAAMEAGNERQYREAVEALDEYDPNEMEELKNAQRGGWNAYDQLKSNLIARGIPADQIRFVQEANNDEERKALFASVNDGEVRVLIGSTPKMGAGTNVQERLVALHHGDVTWKPSDIEQREGRIIRQGNKLLDKYGADNFEVEVLAYATENTIDAKMWDLNSTKLKMINGIRKYDGSFNMEFEDADAVGMAEIAALASGDPLLLERVKLVSQIDKLELLERAHRRKMFGVEDTISDLETAQKNYPARIEAGLVKAGQIRSAVDEMKRNAAGRSVTIEGKVYRNRLEASNALEAGIEAQKAGDEHAKWALNIDGQRVTNKDTAYARINDVIGDQLVTEATIYGVVHRARSMTSSTLAQEATKLLNSSTRDPDKMVHIGQMLGYRLSLGVFPGSHTLSLTLSDGDVTMVDVEQPYGRDTKIFAVQTTRALFDKLEGEIEYESEFTGKRLQAKIDEANTRLPSLREERGKPFAKAEELKSLRDRLQDVITTLDQRTKDAEGGRGRAENPEEVQASLQRIGADPGPAQTITPEARARIEDALTALIRKIVGPLVKVRFVDRYDLSKPVQGWGSLGVGVETAAGSYLPAEHLITIALADPAYPLAQVLDTVFHEAFHALEDRLLTDQEMAVLKREDTRLRQLVQREFRLTDEQVAGLAGYEVRAMAFEHYAGQRARGIAPVGIHIGIRRAFERLMDLFQRVGNMLRGLGYQNAEDILGKAFEGAYASRAGATSQQGEKFNVRPEVRPQGNLNRFESYDPLPENWRDWWKRPDLNWRDRVWGMIDAGLLKANRALGDRYVDMRRMQAAVELAGRNVNEGINMALAATLFEGRTEKRLKDYWLKTWKPVLAEIADMGISRDELHEYLYARHAPERNAHIADINPLMPDGGSGMMTSGTVGIDGKPADSAQTIMERFDAQGKREALERAAQKIDAIVRRIRSTMVADQLEHEETIRGWEQAYQFYVPLQGFESGDEDMAGPIQRSSGFDVRGPETKATLGRSSKADDILSNLFLMGERTIIRGEQNRVGRTAMRFMQSNPQPSLYDVQRTDRILTDGRTETTTENDIDLLLGERPITVQRRNPHTGLVESVTRVASHLAQNSFAVKVGGHTYYVRIKHPGLLTALKSVGIDRLPMLLRAHGWLTRQFAAFRTARNPDWFVANLSRDIQDAAFTLNAQEREALLKHFAANIGTLRSYVGAVMGEMMEADNAAGSFARTHFVDRKWAALYEDWKKNGGQIAFMGIHDLDEAKREIEAAFNETKEGYLKKAAMLVPRTAKNTLKGIEFFNAAIEAGTRLAVYDAALKAGMTKAKAAELSKEATTNFNRKGIHSAYIGSFYAFFNARVQGAIKIPRLLRASKWARRAALGVILAGFSTTIWNLAASPDDEDKQPEYMKRKYWEREKFFIFYMPGEKEPRKIPMGYGLQLFWMLGENLATLSQGKVKPAEAAANYLATLFNAFSPISVQGTVMDPLTWLRYITPSIEMPLVELGTNENWQRKPIHPKWGSPGEPHSEQPFTTTSPFATDVAQFLNKATGGDAFRPGAVDLYPGTVQYVWQFITGGLGQTADRTATMIKNWEAGVPTPANQVPIVRHFVGSNVQQSTGDAYYEDLNAVQTGMGQVRRAIKADPSGPNAAAAASTIEEGVNKFGARAGKKAGTVTSDAEKVFRETDKELKALRQREKEIRNDPAVDRKARESAIKSIRDTMREVQERARRAYREIRQPSLGR